MRKNFIIFALAMSLLLTPLAGNQAYADETVVEPVDGENNGEVTGEDEVEENTIEEDEIVQFSLQEAIDYALENSKEMILERLEVEKAEIIYDFNIDEVEKTEKILDMDIPIPRTYEITPDQNVSRNMVKNGASERSVELAYQIAKWNLETKENSIKYDVEKAYFDLLQAEEELQIAEENFALAQKQYEHGKLRYDVGMISQQQLLGLGLSLSQSQSGYESAKMYYGLQKMSFRNTIGLPLDEEFELTDKIEYREYEPIVLEEAIESGLENNAGIKMAEENYEISKLVLEAKNIKGMNIYYRYKEQEAIVQEAEINLDSAKNGVEMQVRSAVVNLTTAEKQIATFEKAVYQASEGVRIAELSFELGQNTPTEVAQANINLMNAKKNLAQQIHAFNTALLDYKYSIRIGKGF